MVSIPMLLYFDPIGAWNVYLTGTILIYIAAILTIYSMFVYFESGCTFLFKRTEAKIVFIEEFCMSRSRERLRLLFLNERLHTKFTFMQLFEFNR